MSGPLAIATTVSAPILHPLQYDDGFGGLFTYALRARVTVTPGPGEEIVYISLYKQPYNAGGPTGPEEYVDDMYWYQSNNDPAVDEDYYEGHDWGYYDPYPPSTSWRYRAKAFVSKTTVTPSNDSTYP